MELQCNAVTREECAFVASGTTAEELADEIMAHTNADHAHLTAHATAEEHRSRLMDRIQDMIAGGPGTPV